jgi:hypothetical protein
VCMKKKTLSYAVSDTHVLILVYAEELTIILQLKRGNDIVVRTAPTRKKLV